MRKKKVARKIKEQENGEIQNFDYALWRKIGTARNCFFGGLGGYLYLPLLPTNEDVNSYN